MAEHKICPILMAGAMIYEIHTETDHTMIHKVHHDPIRCIGDMCEWFDNGCPAHPRMNVELGQKDVRLWEKDGAFFLSDIYGVWVMKFPSLAERQKWQIDYENRIGKRLIVIEGKVK